MRGTSLTMISVAALVAALLTCGIAGFLALDASARLASRANALASSGAQTAQRSSAAEVEALAQSTASDRATLNGLLNTDVVGIASTIEAAGEAAGTKTSIGTASSQTLKGAPAGVSELEFVVVSNGTFAQTLQAARLFENLPIPSSVQELDFETNPDTQTQAAAPWQLTAHILVLTDANVSS